MPHLINIPYLEDEDISSTGELNPRVTLGGSYDICVVMIKGDFCGYCQEMVPTFQKFADENKDILCAAIKIDGGESEKKLGEKVQKFVIGYQGVPTVIGFRNGKYTKTHEGDRTVESLVQFARSI